MPIYSHRDHRSFRAAYRLLGTVAAATVALVAASFFAPGALVGLLALGGLAVLGGAALGESSSIADGYVDDLRRAARPGAGPSMLQVEVHSQIELDRPVFVGGRPSPHVRRPRVVSSADRGGAMSSRDRA